MQRRDCRDSSSISPAAELVQGVPESVTRVIRRQADTAWSRYAVAITRQAISSRYEVIRLEYTDRNFI
jgi:hypothetical protein